MFTFRIRAFLFGLTLALAPMSAFAQETASQVSTKLITNIFVPVLVMLLICAALSGSFNSRD